MKGILGSGEPCALRIDWTSEGQCLPSQESHIMPEYQEHRKQENTVKIIDPVMNGCQTDTSRIAEQVRRPAARKTYPEPSVACPHGGLLFSHIKLSWHKVGWGSAPSVVGSADRNCAVVNLCFLRPPWVGGGSSGGCPWAGPGKGNIAPAHSHRGGNAGEWAPEDREIDLVRNGSVLRGNSWEGHRMRGRAGHVRSELYTQ